MSVPHEHRAQIIHDLQTHGRCIAIEFADLSIPYDTMVNTGEGLHLTEGWEVPAGKIPADQSLMIAKEGVYVSEGPRTIGRQARLINEDEVSVHGAALAIREQLFSLEKKHAIFEKMKNRPLAE